MCWGWGNGSSLEEPRHRLGLRTVVGRERGALAGITWGQETWEAAIEGRGGPGLLALGGLNTEELGHVL